MKRKERPPPIILFTIFMRSLTSNYTSETLIFANSKKFHPTLETLFLGKSSKNYYMCKNTSIISTTCTPTSNLTAQQFIPTKQLPFQPFRHLQLFTLHASSSTILYSFWAYHIQKITRYTKVTSIHRSARSPWECLAI